MAKARYKQFVGTTINNWLLLEELGTSGNTPQARYSSRKYRVRHTITGEVGIRTMSSIRNSKRPILSKHPKFVNHTGEVVRGWKILGLEEDYVVLRKRGIHCARWKAVHLESGEERVDTYHRLTVRRQHGFRSLSNQADPLYGTWTCYRQICGPTLSNHKAYKHWGQKGYTFDTDRWDDFQIFRRDILDQCGPRPTEKSARYYRLMPIKGKHLCSQNVEWREVKSPILPATDRSNLIGSVPQSQ